MWPICIALEVKGSDNTANPTREGLTQGLVCAGPCRVEKRPATRAGRL